jgi:hypothetical protein
MMNRREALRLGGASLIGATIGPFLLAGCQSSSPSGPSYIFIDPTQREQYRLNAQNPLFEQLITKWMSTTPADLAAATATFEASGDILYDQRDMAAALTSLTMAHLIDPSDDQRAAAVREGLISICKMSKWDYMVDGGVEELGLMRSAMNMEVVILAAEVLGDRLSAEDTVLVHAAIADQGCASLSRTIYDMDHPEQVSGWDFDENHQAQFQITMENWPTILGANNLRAVPTNALGMGALFLQGKHEQAAYWLEQAESSSKTFLKLVSPDGSYFEGLSYINYAFRTLFIFLAAHERLVGTIDWTDHFNAEGVLRFILATQAGRTPDGDMPDIVNVSDARTATVPMITLWLAQKTGHPAATFITENTANATSPTDVLWYRSPSGDVTPPPAEWKNVQLDIGWLIARTGWAPDDLVVSMRSGPPANHEHADRNHLMVKAHGERLLTDHFGAAYDWRQPGWLLRLPEAHNMILLDGKGHQYHNGEEGTNESDAHAYITAFNDRGDHVWWSSDATPAYQLVHEGVVRVQRTVAMAKPDVIVMLDEVVLAEEHAKVVSARFFPDHRDGASQIDIDRVARAFVIARPNAALHVSVAGSGVSLEKDQLDLPDELGAFPYLEAQSTNPTTRFELLTVMQVVPKDASPDEILLEQTEGGWQVSGRRGVISLARDGDDMSVAYA